MFNTAIEKKYLIIFIFLIIFGCYLVQSYKSKYNHDDLILYGNVDIRDVVLGFRVSGRVTKLYQEEGDRVSKNSPLALLDKEPFEKDLNLSKAELEQAKSALVFAEKEYVRQKTLLEEQAVAQKDYDNAKDIYDEALAKVNAAKAQLALKQISLKDTKILAPNNGTILTRISEPGSIVAAGTPVYSLALDNPIWIRTYIDEPNLDNIYQGQKATVITDSGKEYTAQIGFISPQAEFTPKNVETTDLRTNLVYRLRVIIDNPSITLRQGMPVTVKIAKSFQKQQKTHNKNNDHKSNNHH